MPPPRRFTEAELLARSQALSAVKRFRIKKRPGTFRQIAEGLLAVAKGEARFPLPGVGMAGRAMQVRAVGRQQLARVPFVAKALAAGGAGAGLAFGFEAATGVSPASVAHRAIQTVRRRRRGMPTGGARTMAVPDAHQVVKTWQTFPGGPVFALFTDGHIAVTRKNGTVKHYRPHRPVVIPKKWDAKAMRRVATALKRQRKVATAILKLSGGVPTKRAPAPVEHKMRGRDV